MIIIEGITTEMFFEKLEILIDKKIRRKTRSANLKRDLTNKYN